MKLILTCCLLAFFVVTPSVGFCETITVSTIDWCPFICPSSSERPGLLVEYTRAAYEKAGYKVEFKDYPWTRAVKNVESGKTDAVLAPSKSEAPSLVYPEAEIGVQRFCFFSLQEDSWKYEKPESIINRRILHPQDVLPEELGEYKNKANLKSLPYNSNYLKQTTTMLQKGRTESVLMTYYSMIDYLNKNNLADKIKLSGCVSSAKLYLAFSPVPEKKKRNEKIITAFEKGIKELKKEDFFKKLLVKYKLD